MSAGATDVDGAIAEDTAKRVKVALGLTDVGVAYVKRFVRYLLKVNGRKSVGDVRASRPAAGTMPLTQGRYVRQATARELEAELNNRGRKWRPPDDLVL